MLPELSVIADRIESLLLKLISIVSELFRKFINSSSLLTISLLEALLESVLRLYNEEELSFCFKLLNEEEADIDDRDAVALDGKGGKLFEVLFLTFLYCLIFSFFVCEFGVLLIAF